MIPFRSAAETAPGEPAFNFASVTELAAGRDGDLDLVCDGILGRGSFRRP